MTFLDDVTDPPEGNLRAGFETEGVIDIQWLLEDVRESPEGPHIAAFFDFDGTLIDGYSALAFLQERLRNRDVSLFELLGIVYDRAQMRYRGADVSRLMHRSIRALAGRKIDDLNSLGDDLFTRLISRRIYPSVPALIEAHRAKGHTLVVASSATPPQVAPAARYLGIPHVLASELEVESGILTGRVSGTIKWGRGKADAISEFAAAHGIDLAQSFAYANGTEDVEFLERVGHPRPMNPDKGLKAASDQRGWRTIRLLRRSRVGPLGMLRSVISYGWFAIGIFLGMLARGISGGRRAGANVMFASGCDLALAAAGVRLQVSGRQRIRAARPAVFVFNQQSALDVLILGSLIRSDFRAISPDQFSHDSLFAPLGQMAGITGAEGGHLSTAPLLKALHSGTSIAIAIESTKKENTARLRDMAFQIARQARVPMVGIVIRNTSELMQPNAPFMASGQVDVRILPPRSSDQWRPDDTARLVDEVRAQFRETMETWSAGLEISDPPTP